MSYVPTYEVQLTMPHDRMYEVLGYFDDRIVKVLEESLRADGTIFVRIVVVHDD